MSNILIIGGQLFNKGAQAMTFTVIDEIRKRGLKQNIILLSELDYNRPESEKQCYSFSILPYNEQIKFILLDGFHKLLYFVNKIAGRGGDPSCASEVKSVFKNADMILDISGFGITSQWPWRRSILYLMNIKIAKKYNIPIYLLPQSFGPFDYKNKLASKILAHEMRKYLPYSKLIFAREKDGYDGVLKYTSENLRKSLDLVLLREKPIDMSNIFMDTAGIDKSEYPVQDLSVAIIPNEKIIKNGDIEEIYNTYDKIIDLLLEKNRTVHLMIHSSEDARICRNIKDKYQSNSKVKILDANLYCFELEEILSKFDFVIASRYHSIVHSYINGTPAVALGWAVKYKALLDEFDQSDFCFDVRQNFDQDSVIEAVCHMIEHSSEESEKIKKIRNQKCKDNIFDSIFKGTI